MHNVNALAGTADNIQVKCITNTLEKKDKKNYL
jgi:hypothetical protein